jgi:hypothetical protein
MIGSEITKITALVTQDFTQITFEGEFVQDLIVCIYTHDQSEKDGLKRCYRHFVGKTTDKNDISFVVGSWKVLLEENKFKNMDQIIIWSDGGPKHFKISANMRFILSLQQAWPEVNWSYNFFPSFHGCSVCDGAASHLKQAINRTMRDEQIAIRNSQQIISVGSQLKNHELSLVTLTTTDLRANTLKGIKKYHKFTTNKEKDIIYAYSDSQQLEYDHKYLPRNILQLDDM